MNPTIKSADSSAGTSNNVIRSAGSQCVHLYSTENLLTTSDNVYAAVPDKLIDTGNNFFLWLIYWQYMGKVWIRCRIYMRYGLYIEKIFVGY